MEEIKSCDIYDTILARKCIYPNYIFFMMEQKLKIPGFLKARILACSIAGLKHRGEHTFEHIYDELSRLLHLSASASKKIMQLEIFLELDSVIPITGNLEKIDVDTLLISDMYLPLDVIQSALDRVGIDRHHILIKSSTGKYTGKIWSQLSREGIHCDHFGDNQHSDINNAINYGMRATLTTLSAPTFLEKRLIVNGLSSISFLLREARLRTSKPFGFDSLCADFDDDPGFIDRLLSLQANVNLPLLIKMAIYILETCNSTGNQCNILFSSRGSYLLFILCKELSKCLGYTDLTCVYWLSSRDSRLASSPDYLKYCLSVAGACPVFVDLNGSGSSFTSFAESFAGVADVSCDNFILGIYHDNGDENYNRVVFGKTAQQLRSDNIAIRSCFQLIDAGSVCFPEFLNFSPEGKVLDVRRFGDCFLPVRDVYEFDLPAKRLVEFSQSYGTSLVLNLARIISRDYYNSRDKIFSESFDFSLNQAANNFFPFASKLFSHFFWDAHMRSEEKHLHRMSVRSGD